MSTISEEMSEIFYGNQIAQEIIHSSDKYDAVIIESYFLQEPVSALIHKFNCVGIEISSLGDSAWIAEMSGLPLNPAFQLDFKSRLSDEMSILERIYNVYVTAASLAFSYYHMYPMQGIMDKYFNYTGWETRPPLQKLLINRSLILVNSDPVLSYPYPTAPHVKNIAGLNLMPNKPLPNDLEEYMNGSEKGVIYVSLGSNLNTSEIMRSKIGHSFLKIFENRPQRVIIKWEKEVEHSEMLQNVRTGNWFPQRDILAHKNCILFVTHGGFLSLTESLFYGVPVIGLPFFGDQPKNMIQVHKAGYGLMIKDDNISVHSLTWALKEILSNPRYRNEAQRRSQMLRNRQHTPLAEAVYWVEHAIKYPNFLTPKSAFMSFWEKRIFDVGTFIIVIVSIISLFTTTMYISCKTNVRNKEQKAKLE
ncbi:unnamed protein product [Nezara viridula]|uniref:UDP-glucuronosyltransferase n=1 Tax=Nezara viridula TaxID=85310 RepID=A0A9P0GXA1_NEZVI|nr:unnamed protein product [Nezara viridula]